MRASSHGLRPSAVVGARDAPGVEPGERMLLPCAGGPSISRLERWPPPLEVAVEGGVYVLVDDGAPETWRYDFVALPLE
jgi:hypothetical protein